MAKDIIIAIIFISAIVVFGYVFLSEKSSTDQGEQPVVTVNGFEIEVEIADTVEERNQGLSGRPFLGVNEGMLFIFEEPRRPLLWMKNMSFPLDFIFIKDEKVVGFVENVRPEGSRPVRRIMPNVEVLYVLEVNAGTIKTHNIKIGDSATCFQEINPYEF